MTNLIKKIRDYSKTGKGFHVVMSTSIAAVILVGTMTFGTAKFVATPTEDEIKRIELQTEKVYAEAIKEDSEEVESTKDQIFLENTGHGISYVHAYLNDLVGWSRIGNLNFEEDEELIENIENYATATLKAAGQDEEVSEDLALGLQVIQKAIKNKNGKGFLVAHRIFHDLDHHYNNEPLDDKTWGYTKFGGDNNSEVLSYLK